MAMIIAMTGDFETAEDLFQETIVEILKSQTLFDFERSFIPWACGVARNVVHRYWKKKQNTTKKYSGLIEDLARLSTEAENDIWRKERIALRHCLQKVPEHLRKLLLLRYGYNYKGRKLAEKADIRQGSIRTTLSRLRNKLRRCIQLQTDPDF